MTDYDIPEGEALEAARQQFAERSLAQALLTGDDKGPNAISASRLYAYACGLLASDPMIDQALSSDLRIRSAFKSMVAGMARYTAPQAIAASSGDYPMRHAGSCVVRVQPLEAEPNQFLLIVERENDGAGAPTALIASKGDESIGRIVLQPMYNNISQNILDRDSEVLLLLADPNTEIFLT